MTTNYPVDSTTRTCCGGIGRHTRDCQNRELDVAPPAGTKPDIWEGEHPDRQRVVMGNTNGIDGHDIIVWTAALQFGDGMLATPEVHVDPQHDDMMTSTQARELAAVLIAAADEIDGWTTPQTPLDSSLVELAEVELAGKAAEGGATR